MFWRSRVGSFKVGVRDDLNTIKSAFLSVLTTVTATGTESEALCSGELVYVAFEEVGSLDMSTIVWCC